MPDVNIVAVVVAGIAGFFVGGLWYSARMFGSVWNRENGPHPHEAQKKHPAMAFAVIVEGINIFSKQRKLAAESSAPDEAAAAAAPAASARPKAKSGARPKSAPRKKS